MSVLCPFDPLPLLVAVLIISGTGQALGVDLEGHKEVLFTVQFGRCDGIVMVGMLCVILL